MSMKSKIGAVLLGTAVLAGNASADDVTAFCLDYAVAPPYTGPGADYKRYKKCKSHYAWAGAVRAALVVGAIGGAIWIVHKMGQSNGMVASFDEKHRRLSWHGDHPVGYYVNMPKVDMAGRMETPMMIGLNVRF